MPCGFWPPDKDTLNMAQRAFEAEVAEASAGFEIRLLGGRRLPSRKANA